MYFLSFFIDNATEAHYSDLAGELKVLIHLGPNPNIVNLLASCTTKGALWVIMEFCRNGSLLQFLRNSEKIFVASWRKETTNLHEKICFYDLLIMAMGITKGMSFLHTEKVLYLIIYYFQYEINVYR